MSRGAALVLLAVLVTLTSGCELGQDDEIAPPPKRTVTASPSPSTAPAPSKVPVGEGRVGPGVSGLGTGQLVALRHQAGRPLAVEHRLVRRRPGRRVLPLPRRAVVHRPRAGRRGAGLTGRDPVVGDP